jgi:hypothetical protein
MVRWIAFDEETADVIISRFKRGASELHDGNPFDAVLNHGKPSILLMPSSTPGRVLVARIEPKAARASESGINAKIARKFWRKPEPQSEAKAVADCAESVSYEPSGILGLSDEPVFSRPPQPARPVPKRKWWWRKSA